MDGTGKTTHALSIVDHLRKSGIKCKYVWFGTPYFFSYPFMVICRILGLTEIRRLPNQLIYSEHHYYWNKGVAFAWPWVQFVDLAISVLLKVYLPIQFGFAVVCDRFIHDNLVGLMEDIDDTEIYLRLVGRIILRLKPQSASVFLMDVDEATAYKRKRDIPNMMYLTRRRNDFLLIAEKLSIPIINANQPYTFVHKQLVPQYLAITD